MFDYPNCLQLLPSVPPMHHQRVHNSLDHRTERLSEPLLLPAASGVRQERLDSGLSDGDEVSQSPVCDLESSIGPLPEETRLSGISSRHHVLGRTWLDSAGLSHQLLLYGGNRLRSDRDLLETAERSSRLW